MSGLAPFAEFEADMAEHLHDMLANVTVTPASGAPFGAQFDVADADVFEAVQAGEYTLRYLTRLAVLEVDSALEIAGGEYAGTYLVVTHPARVNGQESQVGLVRDA